MPQSRPCVSKRLAKRPTREARHRTAGLFTSVGSGTPGATRTPDTRFRKPVLYPLSYRGTNLLGRSHYTGP